MGFVPQRGLDGLRGQGVKGGPTDEVQGTLREDRSDVCTGVDQPAADLDRLVGGDATGNPKDDSASGE